MRVPSHTAPVLREGGVSLIEALITVFVLSIGMLGMASLQARAQQAELESYQRSQALLLLDDITNRISANRDFVECYTQDDSTATTLLYFGTSTPTALVDSGCDVLAGQDLQAWNDLLNGAAETLAGASVGAVLGARGCIQNLGVDRYIEISVAWQGQLPVTPPPATVLCGKGLYGDDAFRRVVTRRMRFANLQ